MFHEKLSELDLTQFDCDYCEVRLEERYETSIVFENEELIDFAERPSVGAYLRVYHNGKWHGASSTDLDHLKETLQQLVSESKAWQGEKVDIFGHLQSGHTELIKHSEVDPRKVDSQRKKELCQTFCKELVQFETAKKRTVSYVDRFLTKSFKSSKGVSFVYDYADYGLIYFYNLKNGEKAFRDYRNLYANRFDDLLAQSQEVAANVKESEKFLDAEHVEPGKYPIIVDPEITGIFTHESFGHRSEADHNSASDKDTESFRIGSQIANECISIVDWGGEIGGSGYCPIDDDGTPTKKTYLIENGILKSRLHSSDTSHDMDEPTTGNSRALNFEFQPIVRMTSTYIEAGDHSLDALMKKMGNGLLLQGAGGGTGLSTFTIVPRRAYRVRDGQLAEPVQVSVISGTVFETLKRIEACGDDFKVYSSAFGGCGKDEQFPLPVSDGGPSIYISEMQVG